MALACAACRPKHGGGESSTTPGDSGTDDSSSGSAAASAAGSYQCTVVIGDREFPVESCRIGAAQQLTLRGPEVNLAGQLVAHDHGLSLEGTLKVGTTASSVAGDLYRQGAGSYAAVLRLGDSSLARISLVPVGPVGRAKER